MFYALSNPTSVDAAVRHRLHVRDRPSVSGAGDAVDAADGRRRSALPKVIALYSAVWTGAIIVGPAVRRLPVRGRSVGGLPRRDNVDLRQPALVLSTQTFLRQPLPPDPDSRPTLRTAVEGLVFIRRTPVLLARDRARPVRGAVRRRRRADPRDRQGPARRRRRRLRMVAPPPGFGAAAMALCAGSASGAASRRQDAAARRRGVRCSAPLVLGMTRSYCGRVPRAGRAVGGRHGQRVHPRFARAVGDARREAAGCWRSSRCSSAPRTSWVPSRAAWPRRRSARLTTVVGGGVGDAGASSASGGSRSRCCGDIDRFEDLEQADSTESALSVINQSAALLMSPGSSPNDVSTDRTAALSTPVTNGVAAAADDVPDPQIARARAPAGASRRQRAAAVSSQPTGSVDSATNAAG